jgi:membrane-associated phospholipid phosphatase
VVVVAASIHFNISLTPDRLILMFGIAALGTGRVRLFLKDWSIFLVVLLAWQVLTGMSRNFGHLKPHVTEMIVVDKTLFFGHVPTIWLQQHFYHPGHLAWYDVGATVLYSLHFVFPMAIAFALWVWKREIFVEFMLAFLVLALAGFATYVLYPAAPPWIAADWHYLPHVSRIFNAGVGFFGGTQSFSALYHWMWSHSGWDVFGAMPSEHAAFPFLCFLFARKAWPRAGWLLLPYCAAVWLAVMYLGEHYAADVIVGLIYAAVVYSLVQLAASSKWITRIETRRATVEQIPDHISDSVPA